jgi:hypothetical protein
MKYKYQLYFEQKIFVLPVLCAKGKKPNKTVHTGRDTIIIMVSSLISTNIMRGEILYLLHNKCYNCKHPKIITSGAYSSFSNDIKTELG